MRDITVRALQAYIRLLNLVTFFKYLGWIMTPSDDNLPNGGGEPAEGEEDMGAVVENLGKGGGEPEGVRDFSRQWCRRY